MVFHDDFLPSDSAEEAEEAAQVEEMLALPSDSGDEPEIVPGGGVAPGPAASGSSAKFGAEQLAIAPPGALRPAATPDAKRKQGKGAAAAAEGESGSRPPRKTARLLSETKPDAPEARTFLCVVGKPLKQPMAVHPIKIDCAGKRWFLVNEHQYWLRRACSTHGTMHYEVLFQAAVTAARSKISTMIESSRKSDSAGAQQDQMRNALDLSDSEGEGSKRTPKKRGQTSSAASEIAVSFHGRKIAALNQLRPICLECTPEAVSTIIEFCRENIMVQGAISKKVRVQEARTAAAKIGAAAAAESGAAPKQSAAPSATPSTCTGDASQAFSMGGLSVGIPTKVTWQPAVQSWAVHWKGPDKKPQVTRVHAKKDIGASQQSLFGGSKAKEAKDAQFRESREKALREACRLWNELDKSTRPRIELDF